MKKRHSFLPCVIFIYLTRDYRQRRVEIYFKTQTSCYPCFPRIVLKKILRSLFFPLKSFASIRTQLAIQGIKFITKQDTFPGVWAPSEAFRYLPPSLVIFHFRFVILQGKNHETAVKYSNRQKYAITKNNSSDEGSFVIFFQY